MPVHEPESESEPKTEPEVLEKSVGSVSVDNNTVFDIVLTESQISQYPSLSATPQGNINSSGPLSPLKVSSLEPESEPEPGFTGRTLTDNDEKNVVVDETENLAPLNGNETDHEEVNSDSENEFLNKLSQSGIAQIGAQLDAEKQQLNEALIAFASEKAKMQKEKEQFQEDQDAFHEKTKQLEERVVKLNLEFETLRNLEDDFRKKVTDMEKNWKSFQDDKLAHIRDQERLMEAVEKAEAMQKENLASLEERTKKLNKREDDLTKQSDNLKKNQKSWRNWKSCLYVTAASVIVCGALGLAKGLRVTQSRKRILPREPLFG